MYRHHLQIHRPTLPLIFLIFIVLSFGGCATTEQARSVKTSGFLGDYSQLKPGEKNEALLYWIDPTVDFKKYDKIVIDPVTIWRSKNSNIGDLPTEEQKNLQHYLYQAVKDALAKDYTIVETPESGTMRIRIALTEATGSTVAGDVITTYLPPGILINTATLLSTGTSAFVGKAAGEIEIVDIVTNRRIAAAVDRRTGGKNYEGSLDTWSDVEQACDYWAERLRQRLEELRNK